MTSQLTKQTISIIILPNISRSKDNQAMKFGQLIGYNVRNTFLEKPYTKYSGETISLKRGFGGCRHGFDGWDGLGGFDGFSGFGG